MHNWKWVNLSKMAGFNISLSLNERQSSSDKKHNKSLRLVLFIPFRSRFAGFLPFSLSTVKQTKLFHSISEMFFTFLARNTLWVKLFSLNVCEALEAALQAGISARNSHTSVVSDWTYHFSHTCENHRSLLWLARTNLRTKIYDIAFWWVFLSMYIINSFIYWPFYIQFLNVTCEPRLNSLLRFCTVFRSCPLFY